MTTISMKHLLESGVHFGHQTHQWNPKMKPYIYNVRNGIHVINLQKTIIEAKRAYETMREFAGQDKKILFVGTKKQAQAEVKEYATICSMPYIINRWLGGLLTNFQTVKQSIHRLRILEEAFEANTVHELVKTKKEVLILKRERKRLKKDLSGIRDLKELPHALFIIDPVKERIAVNEARKMGIPIFALVDTNCDPTRITYPIPANDDAIRTISLFLDIMSKAIQEGMQGLTSEELSIDDGTGDVDKMYNLDKLNNIEDVKETYDAGVSHNEA